MEEVLKEDAIYEEDAQLVEPVETPVPEAEAEALQEPVPEDVVEELPEESPEEVVEETASAQLQAVADALVNYGGSGAVNAVAQELEQVLEALMTAHAMEMEVSRKVGMLTFALSQLVYEPGAVLALIDLAEVTFDPSNMADLRDFLEPIYQEKPYLFKTINPLRGAHIAQSVTGRALPTNGELGALSMEEYTAYRNARGSESR